MSYGPSEMGSVNVYIHIYPSSWVGKLLLTGPDLFLGHLETYVRTIIRLGWALVKRVLYPGSLNQMLY